MNVDATLISSDGRTWPILAMALYTELGRFPRLFAQVEAPQSPGDGPFTFVLGYSTNDAAALADLGKSLWYVRAMQHAKSRDRYWLSLIADPGCDLQVCPFGANEQGAVELLTSRMDSGKTTWADGVASAEIEALVSYKETFEQLARRIALLTNDAFTVYSESDDTWALKWGGALNKLAKDPDVVTSTGVRQLAEVEYVLEPQLQQVTLPCDYDEALRAVPAEKRVFTVSRLLQLGQSGTEAVTSGIAKNEEGADLCRLRARWYAFTEITAINDIWHWSAIHDETELANDHAVILSSLFLYDGKSVQSGTQHAGALMMHLLGGCDAPSGDNGQGWVAYALAVPLDHIPQEKGLLDSLMARTGVHAIWQQLMQSMGCGYHDLAPRSTPPWGVLPAIVVNNPGAPENGPVSRSDDGMSYRTKIWVRILGVDGEIEIDWAVPFASHDNSVSGGGTGGDLILVPEENTLGYVAFLENQGAPFFYATTHYRDTPVSGRIDPTQYRHGLVTDNGLRIQETSKSILIQTKDLLTLQSRRMLQKLGKPK